MIEREPMTTGSRAAILLALGAVFGLVGLVLFAGGTFARGAIPNDASPTLLGLLSWGPRTLMAGGGVLMAFAAIVLSVDWFQRRS